MQVNFRQRAREALQRAKAELESGAEERLPYVALELRMAIECLTYERAKSYENELPESEYDVWQPAKLMKQMLALDPSADQSGTLFFGQEDQVGEPAKEMKLLGIEKVFNMRDIKSSYDALGSFLHQPTIKQLRGAGHDLHRLRGRCGELIEKLEAVLKSSVFNVNFGNFMAFNCMNSDCGKPIRRRLPHRKSEIQAECFECGAEHVIKVDDTGQHVVNPLVQEVSCADETCDHSIKLFKHEIRQGVYWTCAGCGTVCQLILTVFRMKKHDKQLPINI
ncbi:hypothetical protein [Limnohabitans sp.]|jgi:hypothetical protein|uniref:hypothetical protein n=1 Tax=Limnohabitans sp. TaxID=1907725 RepID=UPI0037BFA216